MAAPFKKRGIPTYTNEADALGVLAQLASHTAPMRRPMTSRPASPAPVLPASGGRFLNEAQSLALLAAHGVPVVVEACSGDVPHKSEHGLVAPNVRTGADAARLFDSQSQRATLAEMGAAQEGVIVAAMSEGRHEFMVGARFDPVFGPVVVVGDGGKYVEALQDVAVLPPPFNADAVKVALDTLRIAPLLAGVRGERHSTSMRWPTSWSRSGG